LVSGATEENIVLAIFGEPRIMDIVISDSLRVVGWLIRWFSVCNRGRLRVIGRPFLSFLFGRSGHYLLSSSPRLLDLGRHRNCYFGTGAEAVELG
jgi:hypothetical protein